MGADGEQDFGSLNDVRNAQDRDGQKPDQRDRTKEFTNARSAALLHPKQQEQNDQGERDHRLFEGRRDDLEAFNSGQHRNSGRDDAVAIKQTSAKDTDQKQDFAQLGFVFDRLRGQRQHGDQTAFAVVVSSQNQDHVLDRHDGGQSPEKDGEDAVDVIGRERHMAGAKHLFHRVQHAGANVAVHHADGAQCQGGERGFC